MNGALVTVESGKEQFGLCLRIIAQVANGASAHEVVHGPRVMMPCRTVNVR